MKTLFTKTKIKDAATIIKKGGLVAVPTETVYGLAGNGLDEKAVEKIYEVKGRPSIKPLSLMVHDACQMGKYSKHIPMGAYTLAYKFWPGPLTIVLEAKAIVPEIVRAGGKTVGLRCPDHPKTLKLLKEAGVPFAAPSANPSGEESPKTAEKVREYFDGKIDAVLDGGECGLGRESTIIDMSKAPYKILRQGALPAEEIAAELAKKLTVIGITGGTGCGKTTALRCLEKRGALIIDCDAVYHKMLENDEKMLWELSERFPGAMAEGRVDRKALGAIVFNDPAALCDLNAITHKHISMRVDAMLGDFAMSGGKLAAIDAVALVESGISDKCKAIIGVTADYNTRVSRIMERDCISREYAEMRVNAQPKNEYYEEKCDYVLINNGTVSQFKKQCEALFKEILK